MNKNTIIGYIALLLLFFGWAWWRMPSKEDTARQAAAEERRLDSIHQARIRNAEAQRATQEALLLASADTTVNVIDKKRQESVKNFGLFSNSSEQELKFYTLENELYTITLTNQGGLVYDVALKDYNSFDSAAVTLFEPETMKFALGFFDREGRTITTEKLYFEPVWYDTHENYPGMMLGNADSLRFGLRLYANDTAYAVNKDKYIEFLYTIRKGQYMLGFEIFFHNLQNDIIARTGSINLDWHEDLKRNEQDLKSERSRTTVYYKVSNDDVDKLKENTKESEVDRKELRTKLDWISFKSRFFLSTLISRKHPFEEANISIEVAGRFTSDPHYLQSMDASIALPWEPSNNFSIPMDFYFGPNKYHTLKDYDIGLEKQVPLGGWLFAWINKGVIWVFDLMSSWNWNYGIIILVLAILIKLILFPLAMKSHRSQAIMKVLKPEMEDINKRYPDKEDAMKKQQATMALYKQAGVNPMGGCLPMLLQLPILIAMFNFFPSSIELRQQSFLWAHDLSSYDAIFEWNANIPLISQFLGNHISLFTILMTISTMIYTHISMKNSVGNTQMPGMKVMMYIMPLIFLGVFNNYAAALSYYYLVINLLTFAQMYVMRFFIDEDKIHQKIKESKGKPQKKSRWIQRMEELAKQQQAARQPVATSKNNPKKKK